ncbi:MAG: hypothetical protein JW850_07650 [Thermoflexales bacterium]|nr:hypothetical protein [Thermoflexales bacterium]
MNAKNLGSGKTAAGFPVQRMSRALMVSLVVLLVSLAWHGSRLEAQGVAAEYSVTAASCAFADVSAAVADVQANGGGIVYLPACQATWETTLQLSGDVSLIGQGPDQSQLTLASNAPGFVTWNIGGGHSNFVRVSGISFYAFQRDVGIAWIFELDHVDNYRIDHCRFEGIYHRAILLANTPKGLIDNNVFKRTWYAPWEEGHSLDNTGYGIVGEAALIPAKPGTPDNVVKGFQAGATARDRNASQASGYTVIARLDDRGNPASAKFNLDETGGSGTVVRLYFYLNTAEAGATVDIGVFSQVTSNTLTTRSVLEGVPVRRGMNELKLGRDFSNLGIYQGDYLGLYLNQCSLAALSTSGEAAWVLAGDHIPGTSVDFGSPAVGQLSIWAELYDSAGFMQQYERDWNDWYSSETAKTARNGVYFDTAWMPDDIDAHYVEDNTFYWWKGAVGPWAGDLQKFVVRHNHFIAGHIKYYLTIFNPATTFGILSDNVFEQTEVQDASDAAVTMSAPGLIYNNTFRNLSRPGGFGGQTRAYQGYYFTDEVRLKETYVFSNTYEYEPGHAGSAGDNNTSWRCAGVGASAWNWQAEDLSFFFRPPQAGERIYREGAGRYNFGELHYPHPLRGEEVVLSVVPASEAVHLSWSVSSVLPPTSTWQIEYHSSTVSSPLSITGILSPTRVYTLEGLVDYTWYTVTLEAMLGSTPFMSDTLRVLVGPTHVSDESGDWDAASTWEGDDVPGLGDIVVVSAGNIINLDADAHPYRLVVEPDAELVISEGAALTVTHSLVNQGTLRQTRAVNGEAVSFLEIGDGSGSVHYRGMTISTTHDLGAVTASVRALADGEYCTTAGAGAAYPYAGRCFEIAAENDAAATVRLWVVTDALNGVTTPRIYRYVAPDWVQLAASGGGVLGDYLYAEADTPGFSHFLVAQDGQAPTLISHRGFRARGASLAALLFLAFALALGSGLALAVWRGRRRRQAR